MEPIVSIVTGKSRHQMESTYWQHYWEEERAKKRATPPRPKRRGWRPSTIGKGESEMNYWQRQEALRSKTRRSSRRAA